MTKPELLRALQTEIHRHTFDYYVENPPAMAQGGKGVVVPGCPQCRKRINTMAQFLDHLSKDVLPRVVDRLFPGTTEICRSQTNRDRFPHNLLLRLWLVKRRQT